MSNMPSGMKKHRESTEPESHQTAKIFSAAFTLSSAPALCCSQLLSLIGHFEAVTEELWLHLQHHHFVTQIT